MLGSVCGPCRRSSGTNSTTFTFQTQISAAEFKTLASILRRLKDAFDEVEAISTMIITKVRKAKSAELAMSDCCNAETDLELQFLSLHLKTRNTALRRQSQTTSFQKEVGWLSIGGRSLRDFVEDIREIVDMLYSMLPGVEGEDSCGVSSFTCMLSLEGVSLPVS